MLDNKNNTFTKEEEEPPPALRDYDPFQESSGYNDSFIEELSDYNDNLDLLDESFDPSDDSSTQINYHQKTSIAAGIKSEIIRDIESCKKLWQDFSPQKSLLDTWEFRYAFYLGYQHRPYFILLKSKGERVALLPLWFEKDKKKYFWFGSWWQEDNSFFVKETKYIPMLLNLALPPLHLNAIEVDCVDALVKQGIHLNFEADDPKYVVDLKGLTKAEDFMATLKKKRRYNLRRDYQKIEQLKPKIIFNRYDDFDTLVEMSKQRFLDKQEATDWEDTRRVETFRQVINLADQQNSYQIRMITVEINQQVAAVDLIAIYKGVYYPLKCAYNVRNFPGIGNYVNLFEIKDALELGMKKVDFLEMSYGWKDKWFQGIPLYKLDKGI